MAYYIRKRRYNGEELVWESIVDTWDEVLEELGHADLGAGESVSVEYEA